MNSFPVAVFREQFPALQRVVNGQRPIFLDGPGGTQVPRRVIDAMVYYLSTCNANHGGVFRTSVESDRILDSAHQAAADLLNAPSPDEIAFGQNMTSLTFHLSRSIARTLKPGDQVVVTRLDHDANVRPWVLAARDAGATVRFVDINPSDCTLDLDDLCQALKTRTKLLAVGAASNVVGTTNDVRHLARLAHDAGALLFVDAVHYAPHGPIDVQAWGCDFLACSAYKFFGPHVGILWGRRNPMENLEAYKVRPAPDSIPGRWMTGTQNHEGLAGVAAAVAYLADVGKAVGGVGNQRSLLQHGMTSIQSYEAELCRRLLAELTRRAGIRVWGIADPNRVAERVPTISITVRGKSPEDLAQHLAKREIYAWNGNMYALELSERLGLEESGGFLRLGIVHYNTEEEIGRLMEALDTVSDK